MACKGCGGTMSGAGVTSTVACELLQNVDILAPDEGPVYCNGEGKHLPKWAWAVAFDKWFLEDIWLDSPDSTTPQVNCTKCFREGYTLVWCAHM